ncbi:MAG: APC family permease [Arenicellales bacterium]
MTRSRGIGFREATSIGVGGMVGGGVFAVLGLAVSMARGGTVVAFAIAGGIALLTTYAYVKLSVAFPGQGGTVSYLNRAFGSGLVTGALNVLLWLSYVIMLSLYAYAFGSYGATFFPGSMTFAARHGLISAVILSIGLLNMFSANVIGKAEDWIVGLKLLILVVFVVLGFADIEPARLAPGTWTAPLNLVAGGMIIFLAYEGFELIANTSEDVRDPARTLPRAFYTSVIGVIVLYLLIAAVTVGNLPVADIVAAKDYALAAAAKPFLGQAGFTLIAVAALLSTASAINATLYGAARLSYVIARDRELPRVLEKKIWNEPIEGLVVTTLATLVIANSLDLSSISTIGSAGFLIIFAAVNLANVRLQSRTGGTAWISAPAAVGCLGALAALVWRTAADDPARLWVLGGMLALAFGIEASYRLVRKRGIKAFRETGERGAP